MERVRKVPQARSIRWQRHLVVPSFLMALVCSAGAAQDQEPEIVGPAVVRAGMAGLEPEQLVGLWSYNSEDSVNVVTGRPERGAPGSAPPRPIVSRPLPASSDPDVGPRSPFAPSPQALREYRDLARDLLEIAETLTFAVDDDGVTITDDLGRSRTYPTDNSRHRYRLGAAEFYARVRWEDTRLHREIEGTFGSFRMTETYFMSPDATRMFLIIRVGQQQRGRQPPGVDRVYDRIDPEGE